MTTWSDLLRFHAATERIGLTLPWPITKGVDLLKTAEREAVPPQGGLLDLGDAAAVRDRVTALAIHQHDGGVMQFRGSGLQVGLSLFSEQLLEEVKAATIPLLDDLVQQIRPTFEKLAEPLEVAVQRYGLTASTTAEQLIDRADEDASAAWRATKGAVQAMQPISRWRILLSDTFGVAPTGEDIQLTFWTDPQKDMSAAFAKGESWSIDRAYYAGGAQALSLDWLAIAATGVTLNTPAEVMAKYRARRDLAMSSYPAMRPGADGVDAELDDDAPVGEGLIYPAVSPRGARFTDDAR